MAGIPKVSIASKTTGVKNYRISSNYTQKSKTISDIIKVMLRVRFISALVISIVLVGGAMWFRFVRIPPYANPAVSVSQVESLSSENDPFLTDFFNTEASSSAASAPELSQTDLIGRQLFSDY